MSKTAGARKFLRLEDAIGYLEQQGYRYGGLKEFHVYSKEGD